MKEDKLRKMGLCLFRIGMEWVDLGGGVGDCEYVFRDAMFNPFMTGANELENTLIDVFFEGQNP